MSLRVLPAAVVVALTGLVTAACGGGNNLPVSSDSAPSASGVSAAVVVDLQFDSIAPAQVTIRAGQTVEWKFLESPIPGNVTFASFASPSMESGTYFHTFTTPGSYSYRDTLSSIATGVIDVLP